MDYTVSESDMVDYFTSWASVAVGVDASAVLQIAVKDWAGRGRADVRYVLKNAINEQVIAVRKGMFCTASAHALYAAMLSKYIA